MFSTPLPLPYTNMKYFYLIKMNPKKFCRTIFLSDPNRILMRILIMLINIMQFCQNIFFGGHIVHAVSHTLPFCCISKKLFEVACIGGMLVLLIKIFPSRLGVFGEGGL